MRFEMQPTNLVSSLCVKFIPVLKVGLWVGGLTNIFVGIIGGIWWPFVTAVALSLHFRLPVPLGMVPPIFDATGNAFVTSTATAIGLLTLVSAYIYSNPIWILSSLLFFSKSFVHRRDTASLCEKFRTLDGNCPVSSANRQNYPPLPILMRIHPYFLRLYSDVDLGGGVRIRRIKPMNTSSRLLTSSIDLWHNSTQTPTIPEKSALKSPLMSGTSNKISRDRRPLSFFIHGGGWKGGGARRHTQPALLHRLVLNGWAVIACNYRKKEWPQHIDDCYNALQFAIQEADELNIDVSRIVISGASAGGQLAALLQARLKAEAITDKNKVAVIAAMVLFYPAIDPADDTNFTSCFPFDLPYFKAKYGQSLMNWFFERAILGDDSSKWLSASPLRLLAADNSLLESWPPTMILHGELDGIVPVEHSHHFLSTLVGQSVVEEIVQQQGLKCDGGSGDIVESKSIISSRVNITQTKVSESSRINSDVVGKSINLKRNDVLGNTNSESNPDEKRRFLSARVDTNKRHVRTVTNIRTGVQWMKRKQDAIVTIPGAKHSFEAVGGDVVEIMCQGVINWLSTLK